MGRGSALSGGFQRVDTGRQSGQDMIAFGVAETGPAGDLVQRAAATEAMAGLAIDHADLDAGGLDRLMHGPA